MIQANIVVVADGVNIDEILTVAGKATREVQADELRSASDPRRSDVVAGTVDVPCRMRTTTP